VHPPQPPQGNGPTAPRSPLWRPGALVGGRYRLRAPLGAGAMGEVWLADHVSLGTTVAVKLVDTANQTEADAKELLARFQLEARAAAQLKSPHVVQILDHGADGRVAFIAMELLEGESLEQRLERRGRLTPSEVAHILREMARGVDRAHAAGVVHRDLKPPNVFLARLYGVEIVKVLDFGIAKILGASRDAHLQTQAGFVIGTPAYMSPEQVLGKPIDHRSDLWQMAVIAFECTTGRRPFDGQTLGQLFMAVCNQPLPVPSTFAALPPAFDAWFARAASRDPAGRFQSAGEMAEALGAILAPGGVGESAIPTLAMSSRPAVAATGRQEAWSTARPAPVKRRPPVAFLAGLALAPLAVLVLGGAWWLAVKTRAPIAPAASSAPVSAAAVASPLLPEVPRPPGTATPVSVGSPPPTASAATSVPSASASSRPPVPRAPRATGGAKPPVDLGI